MNKFPNRWSYANNGTSYEPCIAADRATLAKVGIDASTVLDAAVVDHQTVRGCTWRYLDDRTWGASQIVGNSPSLTAYKLEQKGFVWRADITLSGRAVAISEMNSSTCITHVQSGGAGISTMALYASRNAPPIDEICARAIAFTEATIDKMPL